MYSLTNWNLWLVVGLITFSTFPYCSHVSGQESPPKTKALIAEATAAYGAKDFSLALQKYSEAIRLGSTESAIAYNAACCASLVGQTDTAFDFLDKAIASGWIDARLTERDSDLESLHDDPRWGSTLSRIQSIAKQSKRRWSNKAFQTKFTDNISDAEKAAGLSKLWAEIKFNFVNFHLVPDLDWDAEYMAYMPRVLAADSTIEYYRLLEEMVAKLKDAHTNVYLPSQLAGKFNARPGLRTRLIEDKVIVVKILDAKLIDSGIKIGQEVLKIDGHPVKEYAEQKIAPYMSASTPQDLTARTYNYLFRGPVKEKIELQLRTGDGEILTTQLSRGLSNQVMKFLGGPAPFSLKILDGNIAHVQLNSFGSAKAAVNFGLAYEKIKKTDGMIIDIRNNGGGSSNVGFGILGFLTDKPFQTTRWHTLQYRPTFRAWNRKALSKHGSDNATFNQIAPHHYKKPVVMLVGTGTFSAAEDMAAAFDMLDRGKIIGQPTGGSTGQPLSFSLPGGGSARVCTKHDSYADGTEFVGIGIQPDILVETQVQDIINGFDRALDVARKELQKQR